jgi:protein-L-isoaspartate(D-aspartate) O-methyltransferase
MSTQFGEAAFYQQALIDTLIGSKIIQSSPIEAAFRAVPRHLFLPDLPLDKAYEDRAIPTKMADGRAISSSSQPTMMAIMLRQLQLKPGHHILEIGAGTGYNAALMAHLVGEKGQVTTIDIDEDIVAAARSHLQAVGCQNVQVICADGTQGWLDNAPYDRIILTVGGWDISPAWIEQLTADGRILLPLSLNGPQYSIAFDREEDHLIGRSLTPCGFMRLRGNFAEPEYTLVLPQEPGLSLESVHALPDDGAMVYAWLQANGRDWPTHIKVTPRQLWRDVALWLALYEPRFCRLTAQGSVVAKNIVPPLFQSEGAPQWCATYGIWADGGLAVMKRIGHSGKKIKLAISGYGPAPPVEQLWQQVKAWHDASRPSAGSWHIRAYPLERPIQPQAGQVILAKQWHQFVLQ